MFGHTGTTLSNCHTQTTCASARRRSCWAGLRIWCRWHCARPSPAWPQRSRRPTWRCAGLASCDCGRAGWLAKHVGARDQMHFGLPCVLGAPELHGTGGHSKGFHPLTTPLASARAPAIRRLRPPGGGCTSATGSGCSRPSSQTSPRSSWRTSRHRRWHGWSGMQSAPGSCVSWSRWDKINTKQSEGRGGELSGGWAVQGRTDCRFGQPDCNTLPSARIAGAQACAVASAAPPPSRMAPSGSACCT